jgi:hypothetical protein
VGTFFGAPVIVLAAIDLSLVVLDSDRNDEETTNDPRGEEIYYAEPDPC